jgi:hypothetical protein
VPASTTTSQPPSSTSNCTSLAQVTETTRVVCPGDEPTGVIGLCGTTTTTTNLLTISSWTSDCTATTIVAPPCPPLPTACLCETIASTTIYPFQPCPQLCILITTTPCPPVIVTSTETLGITTVNCTATTTLSTPCPECFECGTALLGPTAIGAP